MVIACITTQFTPAFSNKAEVFDSTEELFLRNPSKTARPQPPDQARFYTDVYFPHFTHGWPNDGKSDVPVKYPTVVLRNKHLLHVQFPSLGGQALRFRDRATGKDIYNSPTKPEQVQTFLINKGLHVSFPTTEHGFNALEAWPYETEKNDSGAAVIFSRNEPLTGISMTWRTTMPHDGYYMDIDAEMTNPGTETQKGMMWIVQQQDARRNRRLFFPSAIVNVHTGFDLDNENHTIRQVIGRNVPITFPMYGGKDIGWLKDFVPRRGIYARKTAGTWTGIQGVTEKRGFVTLFDSACRGVKCYYNSDFTELFVGSTRNLSTYDSLPPGGKVSLSARTIPTTGMTWITEAYRHGVLGVYASDAGRKLTTEYLIADPSLYPKDKIELRVRLGRSGTQAKTVSAVPGSIVRLSQSIDEEDRSVDIRIRSGRKTITSYRLDLDTLPVLDSALIAEPPLNEILADQASAGESQSNEPEEDSRVWKTIDRATVFSRRVLFDAPKHREENEKTRTHDRLPGFRTISSSDRRGNRVYVLSPGELTTFIDSNYEKGSDTGFCYESVIRIRNSLDQGISHSKVKLENADWNTDILALDDRLVLAVEKRLEFRTPAGEFIDTVAMDDFVGKMCRLDSSHLLVSLPFSHRLAKVNLDSGTVTRIPLDTTVLRYPWAVTQIPEGFVVTSGISKTILKLDSTMVPTGAPLEIPTNPLRTQFPGIYAVAYHPGLQELLVGDNDRLGIWRISPADGTCKGSFIRGGVGEDAVTHVRDIDFDGNIIAVSFFYSRSIASSDVRFFDTNGTFVGTCTEFSHLGKNLTMAETAFPCGKNSFIGREKATYSLVVYDSTGEAVKRSSGRGWGPGNFQEPNGDVYVPHAGYFVSDGEKGMITRFDDSLRFVEELEPGWGHMEFFPVGIAADHESNIHALESNRNAVVKFSAPSRTDSPGYSFSKMYRLPDSTACVQRIYRHGTSIIVVDAVGGKGFRFSADGDVKASFTIPESAIASKRSVTGPSGALYIQCMNKPDMIRISADNEVTILSDTDFPEDSPVLFNLKSNPDRGLDQVPPNAVYSALSGASEFLFLDSSFHLIPTRKITDYPKIEGLKQFVLLGDTLVAGLADFPGVALIDTTHRNVTFRRIDIRARDIRLMKKKSETVIGAITEKPTRYVEFGTNGVVRESFRIREGRDFWGFGYTRDGRVIVPIREAQGILVYNTDGTLNRKIDMRPHRSLIDLRDMESALEGPDGRIYVQVWRTGAIAAIDENDSVEIVFNGKIEGHGNLDGGAWFDFLSDSHIVFAEAKAGRIHVIDVDGNYYGAFGTGTEKGKWRWGVWSGHVLHRNALLFEGKGNIHVLDIAGIQKQQ